MKLKLYIILFCFIAIKSSWAQLLPSSANIILQQPLSSYLVDYSAPGSQKLKTVLFLNDFNENVWQVKLKFIIESDDIKLETKSNFLPTIPIDIIPGAPVTLVGDELYEYLKVENLIVTGNSVNFYQNGQLPEGAYSFCVKVLDYYSGKELSQSSCAFGLITLDNPPLNISPNCEAQVEPHNPQNIFFQWQHSGGVSSDVLSSTGYQIILYEVTDETADPYYAVVNNKALKIYETDPYNLITQTSFMFDLNATSLIAGKKYVYRIRAIDGAGREIYRNDGYGEWCWFSYGWPTDGYIELINPDDEWAFSKFEQKAFSWKAPDNLLGGQHFEYQMNLVEINEGQDPATAIHNNPHVFEGITSQTTSTGNYYYVLNTDLTNNTKYAYEVIALTDNVEIAKSDYRTLYGPPLLDEIKGPNGIKIKMKSTETADLNNITGAGYVQLTSDPSELTEVNFSGVSVNQVGEDYYLNGGEIYHDISDWVPLELTANDEEIGDAVFIPNQLRIDKDNIMILGTVKYQLQHAVNSQDIPWIYSKEIYINYGGYKLTGDPTLLESYDFELLEPNDFNIRIIESSAFNIYQSNFSLDFSGDFKMPISVITNDKNPFVFSYEHFRNYAYNEMDLYNLPQTFQPINNLDYHIVPLKITLDFSEQVSPGRFSTNKSWKGLFLNEFKGRIKQTFDLGDQIKLSQNYEEDYSLESYATKGWIDNFGLTVKTEYVFSDDEGASFNTFQTDLNRLKINVKDNNAENAKLLGKIKIPLIDESKNYSYTININNEGLQNGILDEDLVDQTFVFNPNGGENRVRITINRAVFEDNERLDFEIDAEIDALDAIIEGITDFRVYGSNDIGVGSINGSTNLDYQVEGFYKGYIVYIDQVGASFADGGYAFSYSATMPLGDDISDPETGAPRVNISSISALSDDYASSTPTSGAPAAIPIPEGSADGTELGFAPVEFKLESSIIDLYGSLEMTNNDPDWGTAMKGSIVGDLKMPAKVELGANIIVGDKDNLKFWYFDAWFVDDEGMGISVLNMFNLVALEGRVYRHMEASVSEDSSATTFVVSENVDYGAAIYLQMIDPSGGKKFKIDVKAEVEVMQDDFIVNLRGDISALNSSGRTPGSAASGNLADAGAELATAAADMIGDLEITIPISGGDLTLTGGANKAELDYTKGSTGIGVMGIFGADKGAGVSFAHDGNAIAFSGTTGGVVDLSLSNGSNSLAFGFQGSTAGNFNLEVEGMTIGSAFDRSTKSGSFDWAYGSSAIGLGASVSDKSGYANFQLDASKSFNTSISESFASIQFQYDGESIELLHDKEEGLNRLAFDLGGVGYLTEINTVQGSGIFQLDVDQISIALAGNRQGNGSLSFDNGSLLFSAAANVPDKTGSISLALSANEMYAGELFASGGSISVTRPDFNFGIYTDVSEGAGGFNFNDGTTAIEINANAAAKTGNIDLSIDGSDVYAGIATDSIYAGFSNDVFQIGGLYADAGTSKLAMQYGNKMIAVEGNLSAQTGSIQFVDGPVSIDLSSEPRANISINGAVCELYVNDSGNPVIENAGSLLSYAVGANGESQETINVSGTAITFNLVADRSYMTFSNNNVTSTVSLWNNGNASVDVTINGQTVSGVWDGSHYKLLYDQYAFQFNSNELNLQLDATKTIGLTKNSLTVDVDNTHVGLGGDNYVEFNDDNVDFEMSADELSVAQGTNTITIANPAAPELNITSGDKSLQLSADGVSLLMDGNRFSLGKDEYIGVEYDGNIVSISDGQASFQKNTSIYSIGGDNFISIVEGDISAKFTKDKVLMVADASKGYSASLGADMSMTLNDGTRQIGIGGAKAFSYVQPGFDMDIIASNSSSVELNVNAGSNHVTMQGTKGESAEIHANGDFGQVDFAANTEGKITSRYAQNDDVYNFGLENSIPYYYSGDTREDPEASPEYLAGASSAPDMSGPQYIGPGVTEGADGRVKGMVELYYNSLEDHLIANAAVESTLPPCVSAALAIEATPETWSVDIGTPDQKIEITPACVGFQGSGYVHLDPTNLNLGVFGGYSADIGVNYDIGLVWGRLSATAGASIGATADFTLSPEFQINQLGVEVHIYASIDCSWETAFDGGNFNIASAGLDGSLILTFQPKTHLDGELSGYISILGGLVETDFDMSVSTDI